MNAWRHRVASRAVLRDGRLDVRGFVYRTPSGSAFLHPPNSLYIFARSCNLPVCLGQQTGAQASVGSRASRATGGARDRGRAAVLIARATPA